MKLSFFLELVGINAIFYTLLRIVFVRPGSYPLDNSTSKAKALALEALYVVLFIASLPGLFLFGPVDNIISNRIYDFNYEKMRKLRVIAAAHSRPSSHDESLYGLECDRFYDEYGEFRLDDWKKYEYNKLGL